VTLYNTVFRIEFHCCIDVYFSTVSFHNQILHNMENLEKVNLEIHCKCPQESVPTYLSAMKHDKKWCAISQFATKRDHPRGLPYMKIRFKTFKHG
jgi:hypothetical protein